VITASDLAQRLREAREAAGLRQEDAARHLGVSRPAVAQLELGNRAVTGLELGRLAWLYGRDLRDLLAPDFDPADTVLALFRAAPGFVDQDEALEAIRSGLQLARELSNLEGLLGIDRAQIGVPTYPVAAPHSRRQAAEQGERAAAEERRRLGLGGRPVGDAAQLLEEQGIRAVMLDLPEEVSGLTLMERSLSLAVVVNRRHHRLRRRFSWIHEYGHVLLDRGKRGTVSLESRREDLGEVRANAFAAGFLLPSDGVEGFLSDLGRAVLRRDRFEVFDEVAAVRAETRVEAGEPAVRLYEVVLLAHHFQVSRTAAIYRLDNLRLLSAGGRDRLLAEEKAGRGRQIEAVLRLPQPDHMAAREEFRLRFLALALEAYRREKIARGKLDELALLVEAQGAEMDDLLASADLGGEEVEPLLPEDLAES
jgi:Zn-dependent peptidase ImmA (M78 family)/transcriptional regulator with XRE-family HTH domain